MDWSKVDVWEMRIFPVLEPSRTMTVARLSGLLCRAGDGVEIVHDAGEPVGADSSGQVSATVVTIQYVRLSAPWTVVGATDARVEYELFRMLSWQEIGAAAMLSRAVAGVAGGKLVVAMPGSPKAVRLAMTKLLVPELGHLVYEIGK